MNAPIVLLSGTEVTHMRCWAGWLGAAGFASHTCDTPEQLDRAAGTVNTVWLALTPFDAQRWLVLVPRIRGRFPGVRIVLAALESSEDLAIQALRAGVDDYLRAPITAAKLIDSMRARQFADAPSTRCADLPCGLLGESLSLRDLRKRLERLSSADCNVLITGESGTGKELVADAIHRHSPRRHARLVCVNCAAIPDALVESELFGHEKGAFTGADMRREGKLKAADGGMIFLDEVGDLSPYAQAKILRAVETKEIYRLGSHQPIAVDVRILAATHRNLEEMVAEGKFRQDLFFRLNVGRVHIAPLRDRAEDIGLLADHYLRVMNHQIGTNVTGFTDEAWKLMIRYSWPGNVRELKNLVESLLVDSGSPMITAGDLPARLHPAEDIESRSGERDEMMQALFATRWNKTKAAERLSWSRMTLYRKMAKYAVIPPNSPRIAV